MTELTSNWCSARTLHQPSPACTEAKDRLTHRRISMSLDVLSWNGHWGLWRLDACWRLKHSWIQLHGTQCSLLIVPCRHNDTQALCAAAHRPFFTCRCVRRGAPHAPRRTGTEVRGMSDANIIFYLNRTTVPVIGNESLRTQLVELSTPPHHPKWPRAGAWGASRRTGT